VAATPESKVKAKVRAWLQARGIWYCQPIGSAFGPSGVPDIVACWKGRALGIEVKAPGKRSNTTTMQDRQLEQIRAAGGIAIVVDDVSQLDELELTHG
jgi:hypothetical protein